MPTNGQQPDRSFEQHMREFFGPRGVDLDAQAVAFNLFRTQADVFSTIENAVLRPLGLTHAGFVLLMSLWTMGPLETRVLARVQGVSRPAIVSAVDTLERAGHVRRIRSEVDRRLVIVELTPAGRRLVEKAQRRTHAFECQLASVLTRTEQQTLARLLRRLAAATRTTECDQATA